MAYTSGFFDAVDQGGGNYDRVYDSSVFAHYFSLLIGNGVFPDPSTGMQVRASSSPDMHVSISPGSGWINGYYITVQEDFPEDLTVATANPTLNRIDSVVMGLNLMDREVQLYIKSGAVSSNPVAPSLQRDTDLYELELAQIYVGAGVASILQENITDMRMDSSRCGIVSGTVEQIDTTGLFAQYDDAFQHWFDTIKGQLSGDLATNLQQQIDSIKETIGTSEIAGVVKLYSALGTNTDGAMTQAAIKNAIEVNAPKSATSTIAGIMKLYSELGSNVNGTMTQAAIQSAITSASENAVNIALTTCARIEIGSYKGTGKYGSSNPNSLTFSEAPTAVFLTYYTTYNTSTDAIFVNDNRFYMLSSQLTTSFTEKTGFCIGANLCLGKKSGDGKTIYWYGTSSKYQANATGTTYHYVALFG